MNGLEIKNKAHGGSMKVMLGPWGPWRVHNDHPGSIGHLGHIGHFSHFGHFGHIGHIGHFGHFGHFGHIGHLSFTHLLVPRTCSWWQSIKLFNSSPLFNYELI